MFAPPLSESIGKNHDPGDFQVVPSCLPSSAPPHRDEFVLTPLRLTRIEFFACGPRLESLKTFGNSRLELPRIHEA